MDNDFQLIPFDSFDELAKHNTRDDCYVASELIVFDLSNKIENSELLSVEDCGTDVTWKVPLSELENAYIQNFIGYMTEIAKPQTEEELRLKIEGETKETSREETGTGFSWSLEDGVSVLPLLVLLAILISFLYVFSKRRKGREDKKGVKESKE
jgi:hypothetical protein